MSFLDKTLQKMINPRKQKLLFSIFLLSFTLSGWAQTFFDQTLLPEPTGSYAVGNQSLSLTDNNRTERYTQHKSYRRIHVDIWYPAEKPEKAEYTKYLNGFSSELIYDIFKSKGIRLSLLDSIKKTPSYSYENASFSRAESEFPVIIFSPGFYFGMAPLYSAFMENLASQGYIVCSISHPYEQPFIRFTDGEEVFLKKKKSQLTYLELWLAYKFQFRKVDSPKAIEEITRNYLRKLKRFDVMLDLWMEDTQFVLDYFFNEKKVAMSNALVKKMDLDRIGVFGQSFGGALAGQLSLQDSRIKAGMNLDGFQFGDMVDEPLQKPFMLIQSGYNQKWNYGNSAIFAHPQSDFYLLDLPKARHLVFSDAALLPDIPQENRMDMLGDIDGPYTLNELNKVILEFFDLYLKGKAAPLLSVNFPFKGAELRIYPDKEKRVISATK